MEKVTLLGIRYNNGPKIAMAYEKNLVQYVSYEKYLEMLDNAGETRVIETFKELEKNNTGARGQLLGVYDKEGKKFIFVRGIAGRIIRIHEDVLYRWEYPVDEETLEIYEQLSRYEGKYEKDLNKLIQNYENPVEYSIRLECNEGK